MRRCPDQGDGHVSSANFAGDRARSFIIALSKTGGNEFWTKGSNIDTVFDGLGIGNRDAYFILYVKPLHDVHDTTNRYKRITLKNGLDTLLRNVK
jgi:hypothetical protein